MAIYFRKIFNPPKGYTFSDTQKVFHFVNVCGICGPQKGIVFLKTKQTNKQKPVLSCQIKGVMEQLIGKHCFSGIATILEL